jgi:hypothetical protein
MFIAPAAPMTTQEAQQDALRQAQREEAQKREKMAPACRKRDGAILPRLLPPCLRDVAERRQSCATPQKLLLLCHAAYAACRRRRHAVLPC